MSLKEDQDDLIEREIIQHWNKLENKPSVIVFDLDYTLWPNYVEFFQAFKSKEVSKNGEILLKDGHDNSLKAYQNVTKILKTLKEKCLNKNQHLAVASRTHAIKRANEAIKLFGWDKYFSSIQIFPSSKIQHMKEIQKELEIQNFKEILFYDDEERNIVDTSKLGVLAYFVENGVDTQEIIDGLNQFNKKN